MVNNRISDTGFGWIERLPKDWVTIKIKHSSYVKGRVGWHGLSSDEFIDEGPFLVTGTDLSYGKVNWETCYHIDKHRYDQDPHIQLRDGDLLITKDGTIGKVGVVTSLPGPATLNSGLFVVRPINNSYDTRYLYWILKSKVFSQYIELTSYGSTISHLYQNVFVEFLFPLPDRHMQLSISRYLDHKTTQIDALIAKKQRQIELLKEKRSSLITEAVTKGLDPNAKMKDSNVEWILQIPVGWSTKRIKFMCQFVSGGTPSTSNRAFWDGEIPWVSSKDMKTHYLKEPQDHITQLGVENSSTKIVPEGTLLLVMRSGILRHSLPVAVITSDMAINQDIKGLLKTSGEIDLRYLAWFIEGNQSLLLALWRKEGTTVESLESEDVANFEVILPPHYEQLEIINHIEDNIEGTQSVIAAIHSSIEVLHEYRSSLISEAVTGKLSIGEIS